MTCPIHLPANRTANCLDELPCRCPDIGAALAAGTCTTPRTGASSIIVPACGGTCTGKADVLVYVLGMTRWNDGTCYEVCPDRKFTFQGMARSALLGWGTCMKRQAKPLNVANTNYDTKTQWESVFTLTLKPQNDAAAVEELGSKALEVDFLT